MKGEQQGHRGRDIERERERELATHGEMEFWEISGDLGRPLQVLSLPTLQSHNKATFFTEINSYFYNLHTHAHMFKWNIMTHTLEPLTDSLAQTKTDKNVCLPTFIMHKHSVVTVAVARWCVSRFLSGRVSSQLLQRYLLEKKQTPASHFKFQMQNQKKKESTFYALVL